MTVRRSWTAAVAGIALLTLSACGGLAHSDDLGGTTDKTKVTLNAWSFFTGREKGLLDVDLASFHRKYPWINVKSIGGESDDTMLQATRGGNPPDLAISSSATATPSYCASGTWQDLTRFIKRDKVDVHQLLPATLVYTASGSKRCAFPLLTDAFGLYYNTTMLRAAGLSHPPRTWAQMTSYAKKLTVRKPDGTIVRAGFIPSFSFYENNAQSFTPLWDLKWYDKSGQSVIGTDPAWRKMLTWQKSLIDWYGAKNLTTFVAGLGNEFSADNAFEQGKVAMNVDGEWRIAFIKADKSKINYAVAPVPNVVGSRYGGGFTQGTTIGIPNGAPHPEASWLLAHYLAFDTASLVKLANGLLNIPSTKASLKAFGRGDKKFDVLLNIASNPNSQSAPASAAGSGPSDLVTTFMQQWEAGSVSNLRSGLGGLSKDIDAQIQQSAQGSAP